jgi:Na+/proline symporter
LCYRAAVLALPREARLGLRLAVTNAVLCRRSAAGALFGMPAERGSSPSGLELAGLGLYLAVAVAVPLLVGVLVDRAAHSSPLGLLAGLVVGIAAAVIGLWAELRRYL